MFQRYDMCNIDDHIRVPKVTITSFLHVLCFFHRFSYYNITTDVNIDHRSPPVHMGSPPVISRVRVAQSLVVCLVAGWPSFWVGFILHIFIEFTSCDFSIGIFKLCVISYMWIICCKGIMNTHEQTEMPVKPRYGHNKSLYEILDNIWYFLSKLYFNSLSIKVIKK